MLELRNVYKTYEGKPLLRGISFSVAQGETICLLGASGSGKSTLLRIISGLEVAEQGEVLWNNEAISNVPVHRRNFGLMFQDYALFPHKSVQDNVAFGLEMQKLPHDEIDRRVKSVLATVNMTGFELRRITELSGGEQQRVAFARALAPNPRLLMFDEPLGALDRALREQLIAELRGILRQSGVPTIYVTHDQEEAFTIADRIILLHDGIIVQSGTPDEVYIHPVNGWAAGFLGLGNVLNGEILDGQGVTTWRIRTKMGIFPLNCGHIHQIGEEVEGLIRPNSASFIGENSQDSIKGRVADIVFHQNSFKVTLESGLFFYFNQDLANLPRSGQAVALSIGVVECLR